MDILLKLGIILVVGILGGKLAKLVKLPNVSGYLVAGLLIGPSLFHVINLEDVNQFAIISEIALAIIAFSIGKEFVIKEIKKVGVAIAVITLTEVVGAVLLVFFVMYSVFHMPLAFSLVIASMSAATAPAATLLVIRQYRANGPLTRTVLPVVALDDVYGIIAFGIAISIAKLLVGGTDLSFMDLISGPALEIGGSILLGAILGVILSFVSKKAEDRDDMQITSLAAIAVATGLSNYLGFSSLLTNIIMGTVLVNVVRNSNRVFNSVNDFSSPFFLLFFTIAGASLDVKILYAAGWIGVAYIFARGGGKFIGAWFGAKIMKSPKTVQKYLGYTMLPQGGISIGLTVVVRQQLPEEYATMIATIIMFGVLVYEITGPIFSKYAISKAGEINGMDKYDNDSEDEVEPVIETPSLQEEALIAD